MFDDAVFLVLYSVKNARVSLFDRLLPLLEFREILKLRFLSGDAHSVVVVDVAAQLDDGFELRIAQRALHGRFQLAGICLNSVNQTRVAVRVTPPSEAFLAK